MTPPLVKICGLKSLDTALDAARAGADYLGFVFFRKSPRYISIGDAEEIVSELRSTSFDEGFELPSIVGLFVDAGERELAEASPFLTHFQFHGAERPDRCQEMGTEFAIDVIKALAIQSADDMALAREYQDTADMLLFDAKPPHNASRPGGHGVRFDLSVLQAYAGELPYLVAGGLDPTNVAEVISHQKDVEPFLGVDVSSGVEQSVGQKDPALIDAFIKAAKGA